MIDLDELASRLDPERTVLFLGAGASVPSGGPTAQQLGTYLAGILSDGSVPSEDFNELCSILELRSGRRALVDAIRARLQDLEPTGGMLGLATIGWSAIYTTNYDQLVERSYRKNDQKLQVFRSNYDFGTTNLLEGTSLYKIHGCISQDTVDGHKAAMLLTEEDLRDYDKYRQVLFRQLSADFTIKNVVVIGNSLRDSHLKHEIDTLIALHRDSGAPGRLYILSYESDPDRAALLESRGAGVAIGNLDSFLYALISVGRGRLDEPSTFSALPPEDLGPRLSLTTLDAARERNLHPNAPALFNGRPATFADIASGFTFERSSEEAVSERLRTGTDLILSIVGAGGVGKTTFARRIAFCLMEEGFHTWEHRSQFPFVAKDWIAMERKLARCEMAGVLILDDCTEYLAQVNLLATHLSEQEHPALRLILTAIPSHWKPRLKSSAIFSKGTTIALSVLMPSEIEGMLNLLANVEHIRSLVEQRFSNQSRSEQQRILLRKCSADMYVCLKNVFATEGLDTILLQEYAALSEDVQEAYRHVAAIEATGTQVHRQLVLRLLATSGEEVAGLLESMEGIVEEFDIDAREGLFGWSTRHRVIAQTITQYKFADAQQRFDLLKRVISQLNPITYIERRAVVNLCDRDFGIGSLSSAEHRIALYRDLIAIAPGERVPWHRLISDLLRVGNLEQVDQEIRNGIEAVRLDSPLNRFKVRLAIERAQSTPGILPEDRRAMLLRAEETAKIGIARWAKDKYAYRAYVDTGLALAELDGSTSMLDVALEFMQKASRTILDPDLAEWLQEAERTRRKYP